MYNVHVADEVLSKTVELEVILIPIPLHPIIGPPKEDRKQSIKDKNNRSLSFHFDFLGLSVCGFVVLSGFLDVPLYLKNYLIKLKCMHIIRTSSMRGLK